MPKANWTLALAGATSAALLLSACGGGEPSTDERCQSRKAGDLVISEFMNDPAGRDSEGHEWIEVFNATGAELDLRGFSIVHAAADGSAPKEFVFNTATVAPDGYYVAGNSKADPRPAYENQSYVSRLGDLRNSSGLLQIKCGSKIIDEVKYTDPKGTNGHSNELDGKLVPDSAVNDQESAFCASQSPMDATTFGTPGQKNAVCGAAVSGNCTDPATGQSRAAVLPAPGELIITEFMPDPSAVLDTAGEWIEVHAPTRAVDLNGLVVESGSSKSTLGGEACLTLGVGEYAVLARGDDPAVNGGLPVVTAVHSATLPNSGGTLTLRAGETTVVDQISWTGSTSGTASQLSADKLNDIANDDPLNFCAAEQVYGQGDLGTPGTANRQCPPVVMAGQCIDADTGLTRDVVKPVVGDLVLTEVMPNPSGTDSLGEWFELTALKDVDLNGLRVEARSSTATTFSGTDISGAECVRLPAGSFAIFATNNDPATNGGLPFVTLQVGFSLNNTGGVLRIVDGTTELDAISWSSVTDGAAIQLDPTQYDPVQNDDPANFCNAQIAYGTGANTGTPGSDNHSCTGPVAVKCFDTGAQALRDVVAPQPGELVITELHQNPAAVSDTVGEFFEVAVMANVDLNGLQIANAGTGNTTLKGTDCIPAAAGSLLVFGKNTDPAVNGGIQNMTAAITFGLANSASALILRHGTLEIDRVSWTSSLDGVSTQLSSDKIDHVLNDDIANFCPTSTASIYGAGDRGTPGTANELCP